MKKDNSDVLSKVNFDKLQSTPGTSSVSSLSEDPSFKPSRRLEEV